MTEKVPILFLIFNRPKSTEIVFNKIREYQPDRLYIACDGPRASKQGEASIVEKTKKVVDNLIDWKCEIKTLYRESNLGCKEAVRSAIDWFFENEEMGIILEDDCVPHIDFFTYCSVMLLKYRDHDEIMCISGTNFINKYASLRRYIKTDYFFSKYIFIWGWATWRRAWKKYDQNMEDYHQYRDSERFAKYIDDKEELFFWKNAFDSVYTGRLDTWDFQWVYCCYYNNGKCIIPSKNLISNIGFGIEGNTHGANDDATEFMNLRTHALRIQKHPRGISTIKDIDDRIYYKIYKKNKHDNIIKKNKRRIVRYFSLYKAIYSLIRKELTNRKKKPELITYPHNSDVPLRGSALVSYIRFTSHEGNSNILNPVFFHSINSRAVVELLSDMGFDVDVIDFHNATFIPDKKYRLIFDVGINLDRISYKIGSDCIKIFYMTGCYPEYSNNKILNNVDDFENRKKTSYYPKGIQDSIRIKRSIDKADLFLLGGNDYVKETYQNELRDKIHKINPFIQDAIYKEYEPPFSREFIWFHNSGAINNGLDFLLDIFSRDQNIKINIVSDLNEEFDFISIYEDVLYNSENIRYYKYSDLSYSSLIEIIDRSFCFISLGITEEALHNAIFLIISGLFPIINVFSNPGIDRKDCILLNEVNEKNIRKSIRAINEKSDKDIIKSIINNRKCLDQKYTEKLFKQEMTSVIKNIIESNKIVDEKYNEM